MGFLTRIIAWVRRLLRRMRWRRKFGANWRPNPTHPGWLNYIPTEGADNRPYTCAEYVEARIRGQKPRWGAGSGEATTDNIAARLTALGWVRGDAECQCGCGGGQCRDCVVLYVDADGDPAHAAIFDRVRCDWGGKLGGGLPIARFMDPGDYNRGVTPPFTMQFWCPRKAGPGVSAGTSPATQLTDEALHALALAP
jgi:hypothetical protein